jgi:hypothetical protein
MEFEKAVGSKRFFNHLARQSAEGYLRATDITLAFDD